MMEGGNSCIFKHIDEVVPERLSGPNTMFTNVVGIDVGQQQDNTVVSWCKYYPGTYPKLEVVETLWLQDKYDIQCDKIKTWIYEKGLECARIGVEVNGVGRPIYDFLCKKDVSETNPIIHVAPFTCNARNKKGLINLLQGFDYNKCLYFTDKKAQDAINGLTESYDNNGKWTADHSDALSSLIVCASRLGY